MQTWAEADAFLRASRGGAGMNERKVGNNTYLRRAPLGTDIAVRLHGTDVVTYHDNGTMTLNTGGWDTVTTMKRINGFSPVRTYRTKGVRVVSHPDDPVTPEKLAKCSGETNVRDGWAGGTRRNYPCVNGRTTRERFEPQRCDNAECRQYEHTPWSYSREDGNHQGAWRAARHNVSVGVKSATCTTCNGAGIVDRGSRTDPIVWDDLTITIDEDGRVVHDNGDPMVNAHRLSDERERLREESRRMRELQAQHKAELAKHAAAALHLGDGETLFYKGVDENFQSPVQFDGKLTYTPGTTVDAREVDLDPWNACGAGVNFTRTPSAASRFGSRVVSLVVPTGEPYVDAGDKLRAARVSVVESW